MFQTIILLYYVLASCCTVLFNGYCRLWFHLRAVLLYFGFHCLSLHASAYMAIFKCVGFFIYEGKQHRNITQMETGRVWPREKSQTESFKHMKINILHTWRWPYRPKHVAKDNENQHNKAARRRKHNLQYPLHYFIVAHVFVAAVTFLLSRYLSTIGDRFT
jgi:hypothetical protein